MVRNQDAQGSFASHSARRGRSMQTPGKPGQFSRAGNECKQLRSRLYLGSDIWSTGLSCCILQAKPDHMNLSLMILKACLASVGTLESWMGLRRVQTCMHVIAAWWPSSIAGLVGCTLAPAGNECKHKLDQQGHV